MSINPRGRFGYGKGYGFMSYGKAVYGACTPYSGVFQRKKTLQGWRVSQMRFGIPNNPRTVPQQSWRATFAEGLLAWRALDDSEKVLLSKKARNLRMTGFNLFMSKWLQSRRG